MPLPILDPALRAGWEPNTPAGDTILRQFLINFRETIEALGSSLGGRNLRRDDVVAVDVGRPAFIVNTATLQVPLAPEAVEETMSSLDEFYGLTTGTRTGSIFIFSPWPTPDLRPLGWTLGGYPPLMLRAAGGEAPAPPPGLRIEEARDEAALRACEEVTISGFGIDAKGPIRPGSLFGPELIADARVRMGVGWEGDRPVSTAATFVSDGINDVFNVATVPEARRRGYAAAVAWRATLADPALPTLLIASDEGRFVYEQMGYLPLFRFTLWRHQRPAPDAS